MWFALFDSEETREKLMSKPEKYYKLGLYSKITLNFSILNRLMLWKIPVLEMDILWNVLSIFDLLLVILCS